ncbi:MAG: NUDIX domain-containing protein [Patescibacteria group bacterium]
MKLLKTIKDKDLPRDESSLEIRECSRGVFVNKDGLIPLLFASNIDIHELPGGGIDPGEDRHSGLVREVLEEAGGEIEVTHELGKIIEYRSKINRKQISYCYFGKIKSVAEPTYTEEELRDGTILEWMTIDEAIAKVKGDKSSEYEGPFIQERDLFLLELAKSLLY